MVTAFGVGRWARSALASAGALLLAAGLTACSGDTSTATSSAGHTDTPSTHVSPGPTETMHHPSTTPTAGSSRPPTTGPTGSPSPPHTSESPTSPAHSGTTSPQATTAIKTFTPFGANGEPTIHITATRTGYCWSVSIATSAAHAYRCMAHNQILDPCFAADGRASDSVVCVPAPWEPGTRLTLNRRLPTIHPAGSAEPRWAIELANGARCVAVTGTVQFVGKIPMNYACADDAQAGALQHDGTLWSVAYLPPHGSTTTRVEVATVWR